MNGKALALLGVALLLGGCKVALYSSLNEQEANEVVAALTADGIGAEKSRTEGSNWQVDVERDEMARALDLLRIQGLPSERFANIGQVFQKQGLVATPSEERMRYIYAVSQELAQTLKSVDGVVTARVHVVIPTADPLAERVRPSSAAVFIKHRSDVDIRILIPTVKDLVAHSIEGLTHDQVSLSLVEARRPVQPPVAAGGAGWRPDFSSSAWAALWGVLAMGCACLLALPWLLRRRGVDWREWMRRNLVRR